MNPSNFEEQTHNLGAPKDMEECGGLPVIKTDVGFTSCWELTEDEWLDIRNNGLKVWLTVYGEGHPPVSLSVEKPFTLS